MNEQETLKLIGQRIRNERTAKKMSQADLSFDAGISVAALSDIENGKSQLKLITLIRIINALHVSADKILRTDAPEVKIIYQEDFNSLLADCSATELESLLKIMREVKDSIRNNKPEEF